VRRHRIGDQAVPVLDQEVAQAREQERGPDACDCWR
jgi:hypothetical protein